MRISSVCEYSTAKVVIVFNHRYFEFRYVSEAHPADEWHVYSDIDYCQPKTLDQRAAAVLEQ